MTSDLPGLSVAEATEADAGAFGAFLEAAWREAGPAAPGFTGATDQIMAELTRIEAVRERLARRGSRTFLARRNSDVIGFAANRRIDEACVELAGIIVLRSVAGKGVGRALLRAAKASARHDGYAVMAVRTEVDNHRALAFYEAGGFVRSGVVLEAVDDAEVEVRELTCDL